MRVFFCLFLILCFSCSDNDSETPDSCVSIIFDESKFSSSENFGINLIEYNLDDDCLYVKLGVSGCDDNHKIDMISDGAISPSDHKGMVFFDFYDNNPQACEAYITLEREFDLEPIRTMYKEGVIVTFRNNQGFIEIDN